MSGIRISEHTIAQMIDALRNAQWQVPKFQREFVWDPSGVAGLATSIIDAYPIGMITLWEQSDRNPLELERLSIQDYDGATKSQLVRYFGEDNSSSKIYAILDGRQRCTAIAMAFAGFTPHYKSNKYAGRYFLNAGQPDPLERVVFKKAADLTRAGLETSSACIGQGLFPLASDIPGETVLRQWYRYAQEIKNPQNYPGGVLPEENELNRRDAIVQSAFDGISETRLAACTVPENYDLGKICDIFETLNLSGMKVSTVDLINAWIYRETEKSASGPIQIREWIKDLGQIDGAVGWAVPERRPELTAQLVTAAFVALEGDDKPPPRQVSGSRRVTAIDSIKSPDLLATPAEHWQHVVANEDRLALFLGDFQRVVANGPFGYDKCPYPVSATIYTGLRWHKEFDPPSKHLSWAVDDLNSLFRAFFWRNALSSRYDQGFLTQLPKDLSELKKMLRRRADFETKTKWLAYCEDQLSGLIKGIVPDKEALLETLTNGRPGGAKQAAVLLPMIAGTERDIEGIEIGLLAESSSDLHHIFPRSWCSDNAGGVNKELLNREAAGRDWVNSIANLMPLARSTNNSWKTKLPSTFLSNALVSYTSGKPYFDRVFIGESEYDALTAQPPRLRDFWEGRAIRIADDLLGRCALAV